MTTATFDSLAYVKKLEEGGFSRQQAETQADAMRQVLESHAEANRNELPTKGDIKDLELKIEKVRYDLLKWYIGGWVALAAIMAKGFHWFGF